MSLVENALRKLRAQAKQSSSMPVTAPAPAPVIAAALGAKAHNDAHSAYAPTFEPVAAMLMFDNERLRQAGLLAPANQERELARQLRTIKHGLLRLMTQEADATQRGSLRAVMLTSALPGDGKTFTSFNLAVSLALEKDFKVILVDADVAKPHLTDLFGLTGQQGLLEVLAEPNLDIGSVVRPTNINNLYFVPAGKTSEVATELLSSDRLDEVMQRLTGLEPNVLVLFDSPPVLVTSESRVLAEHMGHVLVVVRAGLTPQAALSETVAILGGVSIKPSLVLNGISDANLKRYPYGYGYSGDRQ